MSEEKIDKLNGEDIEKHRIIVGHADALDLAHKLGCMLEERFNKKLPIEYVVVNPTAGSHCGPDTIGVCFYAKHRFYKTVIDSEYFLLV